jgi:hypothetical protein
MGAAKGYRDVATLYAALTAAVKGRKIKI